MKNTRIKFCFPRLLALAFVLCLSTETEVYAAAFTVNTLQDNEANGCGVGVCTLREAVTGANSTPEEDTIVFQNGLNGTILLTNSSLNVTGSVTIAGPGARNLSVSCNINRVFLVSGASVTANISGLTITGNNLAGGISNFGGATLNLTEVSVSGNRGATGGGVSTRNGAVTNITRSLISNNTATAGGGGIDVQTPSVVTLVNSTVHGNTAVNAGGGIGNLGGTVNLTNVTVTQNTVTGTGNGAGIGNFNAGTINIRNTIIAGNTKAGGSPDDASGFGLTSFGGNIIAAGGGLIPGTPNADNDLVGSSWSSPPIIINPLLGALQNNGGATDTRALLAGSPAIDFGNNCIFTAVCPAHNPSAPLVTDQRGAGFPRRNGNRIDSGAFEAVSTTVFNTPFDFDGDAKTDVSIFRPAVGEWWYLRSSDGGSAARQFGLSTDKLTPGDFTGDGKTDIAFFRPASGFWYILRSEDNSFFSFPFGTAGDVPVPSDYDGDGRQDAAVFRPSTATWYILNSGGGGTGIVNFGSSEDKPVPADFDGDGKADIAVFRPSDGSWWYLQSSISQFKVYRFGVSTDKPVQGDYSGDGKADLAVFRPSTGEWFIQRSEDNSYFSFAWGQAGDVPAAGDYDGDGRQDASVFRPSNSTWYLNRTSSGVGIVTFGSLGDQPVPNAFVP